MKKSMFAALGLVVALMFGAAMPAVAAETVDTAGKLQTALNAGGDVTLGADIDGNFTIPEGVTVNLDLGSHALNGGSQPTSKSAAILNKGTLVISGEGTIKREDTGSPAYYVLDNQGTMTINSGTFANGSGTPYKGSSLIRNAGSALATLNINGGTFTQDNFIVIKNDDYGVLNITGGTFNTKVSHSVENWAKADISGGEFNGLVQSWTWSNNLPDAEMTLSGNVVVNGTVGTNVYDSSVTTTPKIAIDGGTYASVKDWSTSGAGSIEVKSGFFAEKVEPNYLVSGVAEAGVDGTYVVGTPNAVKAAAEGAKTSVDVVAGVSELKLAEGVKVTNSTGSDITVNGSKLPTGSTEPAPHAHNAVEVPAKAATTEAEGNIQYWYCEGCGKYFSDEALTKEISQVDTVLPKLAKPEKPAADKPTDKPVKKPTKGLPQTGDASAIAMAAVSAAGALACTAGVVASRRRK